MTEEIEIPFGAFDSETMGWTYTIPEGFIAKIEDWKIIVEKKESDDKQIIDALTKRIQDMYDNETAIYEGVQVSDILAWLEKQKDAETEIEKAYKNADEIQYKKGFEDGVASVKQKEQNSSEWVYRTLPGTSFDDAAQKAIEYAQNGENIVFNFNGFYYKIEKHTTLDELCKEYDAFGKRQTVAEWSEEDETALSDLMWCIEQARKSAKNENDMGNIWFAENWVKKRIKSLRPQPHWKPSEEHFQGLRRALKHVKQDSDAWNSLADLYKHLQKLL